MKKNRTEYSHLKLVPDLDMTRGRGRAYLDYGHKSHALIPMHSQPIVKDERLAQLSELLNDLEKRLEILSFRLQEVLDTWIDDTLTQLAEPNASITDTTGTDMI